VGSSDGDINPHGDARELTPPKMHDQETKSTMEDIFVEESDENYPCDETRDKVSATNPFHDIRDKVAAKKHLKELMRKLRMMSPDLYLEMTTGVPLKDKKHDMAVTTCNASKYSEHVVKTGPLESHDRVNYIDTIEEEPLTENEDPSLSCPSDEMDEKTAAPKKRMKELMRQLRMASPEIYLKMTNGVPLKKIEVRDSITKVEKTYDTLEQNEQIITELIEEERRNAKRVTQPLKVLEQVDMKHQSMNNAVSLEGSDALSLPAYSKRDLTFKKEKAKKDLKNLMKKLQVIAPEIYQHVGMQQQRTGILSFKRSNSLSQSESIRREDVSTKREKAKVAMKTKELQMVAPEIYQQVVNKNQNERIRREDVSTKREKAKVAMKTKELQMVAPEIYQQVVNKNQNERIRREDVSTKREKAKEAMKNLTKQLEMVAPEIYQQIVNKNQNASDLSKTLEVRNNDVTRKDIVALPALTGMSKAATNPGSQQIVELKKVIATNQEKDMGKKNVIKQMKELLNVSPELIENFATKLYGWWQVLTTQVNL